MIYLIYAILIIYLTVSVYKSYTWLNSYLWLKRQKNTPKIPQSKEIPGLYLFIPALREQSLVQETIEYFRQFHYPAGRISCIFITTEKEKSQKTKRVKEIPQFLKANLPNPSLRKLEKTNRGLFPRDRLTEVLHLLQTAESFPTLVEQVEELYERIPLTHDLIKAELSKLDETNNFHLIHYPNEVGNKPEQLNYALANFDQYARKNANEVSYIGVYDFDARPDLRTGLSLMEEVQKRQANGEKVPAMIQQIQIPYSNLDVLNKKGFHGMLMRGFATLYLRRALGIELYKMRKMLSVNKTSMPSILKALLRPVTYGIGSGMFVNLQMLKKIGGFPVPLEDLATGYRVSLLGEDIVPLPVFNMMEAYDSYRQMSNSGSICFLGAIRISRDYRVVNSLPDSSKLTKMEKLALVAKEWLESSVWLFGMPLLLVVDLIALLATGRNPWLIALITLPILLRCFIDTFFLQIVLKKICHDYRGATLDGIETSFLNQTLIVLTSPIQGATRVLAPLKALLRLVKENVLQIKVVQTKTER